MALLTRASAGWALALAATFVVTAARAVEIVPVDIDDDDRDGVADGKNVLIDAGLAADLARLPSGASGLRSTRARLVVQGRPVTSAAPSARANTTRGPALLQGLSPGRVVIQTPGGPLEIGMVEVRLLDGLGAPIDVVGRGVSLSRSAPSRLPTDPFASSSESTFRAVVIGHPDDINGALSVTSISENGAHLDALTVVATSIVKCPDDTDPGLGCRSTLPLRLALDDADRHHPVARERSVIGELGGGVSIALDGRKMTLARVTGPTLPGAAVSRYRATLRVFLIRDRPRGAPPFGVTDGIALAIARAQIKRANVIWGQCGVSFGPADQAEIRLIDPPPPHLLALGCDLGVPASGGEIRFRAEGKDLRVSIASGDTPSVAAQKVARSLETAGLVAQISDNLRIGPGALPTTDVLVRRRDGAPARVEAPKDGLTNDATLGVCLGSVDLTDGLAHFADVDAVAGTLEERAILRAVDDGDPRTIEVIFVPAFATGGRIGESFIRGDRASLPNMVIEDRAGVRADTLSFALAHELGHVLLDVPGHADDFGVDTPTRLMDSDAADSTAFGPRRLDLAECARAVTQSGPRAPAPLLTPWPLTRMKKPRVR